MTSATDVLEAVARGIAREEYPDRSWRGWGEGAQTAYRNAARAAITALEPVIVEAHRAGKSNEPSHLYAARIIASLRAGGEP